MIADGSIFYVFEAVFDKQEQVFITFQGQRYVLWCANFVFKVSCSHSNFETTDIRGKHIHVYLSRRYKLY